MELEHGITDYVTNAGMRGDAVYETSGGYSGAKSWFAAYSYFPSSNTPFFHRGGIYNDSNSGMFFFDDTYGNTGDYFSFRMCLAF